jgi:hypothetical protein
MQSSVDSVNASHLQTRKYFATIEIFSMVELSTIERLAIIEKLCDTMNLLSSVNGNSNRLSVRMQVALEELPSLVELVEEFNRSFAKEVIFIQPAARGDKGRGKSRIVFSSNTPTYAQLAEVIKLTDVNVLPALSSAQWKCLVAADDETRIPSVVEIQAGGRNFPLDFETFEGVLANKTKLNFSIQSASGSYARSYNNRFCSVNLNNYNRCYTFVFENKNRVHPDRDAAIELANAFQKHNATSSNFLGVTLGTWVRPVSGIPAPSSVKFHFAVEKDTEFSELRSTMRQLYKVVAGELGHRGLQCDFKNHRLIPVESYAQKMSIEAVKQQIFSRYNITLRWQTDKHRVCHYCGQPHNAVLCPLTVIMVEEDDLLKRVDAEARESEEANIQALQTPADAFCTRFVDPLAPHNRLAGGCAFIYADVPDEKHETTQSILEKAKENWHRLRPSDATEPRVRHQKRVQCEENEEEEEDDVQL